MTFLSATCVHPLLCLDTDEYASRFGYLRPTEQKRVAAALIQSGGSSSKSKTRTNSAVSPSTFPGPLLLPGDDLSIDPKYPAQSLRQWARDKDRNPVTPERNVVYVVAPPIVDDSVRFMDAWARPATPKNPKSAPKDNLRPPVPSDVVEYLSVYYHGMKVKTLSENLKFTSWDTGSAKKSTKATERPPKHVGLTTSTECIRIRTRSSHDGLFHRQLNLNDLLDGAIAILPNDAYALLLLVNHDLYEDDDDDFACGRAYGGSRVAVVSSARYHPKLDSLADVDVYHAWPASHCSEFIEHTRETDPEPPTKRKKTQKTNEPSNAALSSSAEDESPITNALKAHKAISLHGANTKPYEGLWLGRVCKTAAHEVGHCFGMDHCVYYACAMQGTASLAEDARQPPYLCPVDLAKMLNSTGANVIERYQAIQKYCSKHAHVQLFAAFHAWIAGRLKELSSASPPTT